IFSITNTILDAVCEFFLLSLTVSALTINRQEWLSLNNNFQNIDKMMFKRNQKESIFSNIYLHFVLYIFIVLSGICYMSYIWQIKVGSMMWHTYGMHELFSLYDGLLHFLIFAVAIALARRYEDLNQLLDVNPILNNEKFWNKHQTMFIRKIAVISRVLAEMIDSVNNIFGWSLIAIAMVTMSCDTVLSKSRKTLFLCYKLQERLPANSHVRYELYNLAKHLKVNITSITAANFFEINKNCLI
ncbi:unnamed protein product, partial [Tenebrio molitor]